MDDQAPSNSINDLCHICYVIQHENHTNIHTRIILYDFSNDVTKYLISNALQKYIKLKT